MAGPFSGHLINTFTTPDPARPTAPDFEQPTPSSSQLATHGAMSFNPTMHGSFESHPSFDNSYAAFDPSISFSGGSDISEANAQRIAQLQSKLDKKLGPEFISQRPGPGGGPKLTYAEGWKIINLANDVFGFNGWSSKIVSLTTDFCDEKDEGRRVSVGVTAIVRVTLRDGVHHEDIGYGSAENMKGKAMALDKCKKEAVTDAVKRTLRNFGNLLGNCLYDKDYAKEIVKVKVQPAKFDKNELYRRPEFATPNPVSSSIAGSSATAASTSVNHGYNVTAPRLAQVKQEPLSIPTHMRTHMGPPSGPTSGSVAGAALGSGTAGSSLSRALPPRPVATSTPQGKAPEHAPPRGPTPVPTPMTAPTRQDAHSRHVSFAPTAAPQPAPLPPAQPRPQPQTHARALAADTSDDSFSYAFASDDDAMYAAAAEFDLDVDVELDAGVGGPIDFDEGPSGDVSGVDGPGPGSGAGRGVAHLTASAGAGVEQSDSSAGGAGVHASSAKPPAPAGAGAEAGPGAGANVMTAAEQRKADRRAAIANALATHNNAPGAAAPAGVPQAHQQQQQRFPAPAAVNGNTSLPSSTSSNTGANGARRASAQSGGSFNFSPGVNPAALQKFDAPPTSGAGAGFKRSADTMQGSTNHNSYNAGRRPAQGMGLTHQGQPPRPDGGPAAVREPLASLSIGEGGVVKRARR